MTETDSTTGIAIVGMAGRFPGAATLTQFWRNLCDGVESISFFTPEELAAEGIDPDLLKDPRYVPARGVLAGPESFDAAFFGLTPREAELMDPQHRVLLECAWEALEDAGYAAQGAGGRTAVFAGANLNTYLLQNLLPNRELLANVGELQAILLNNNDFLATRISYKLDLKGPSALVQTACSTGLMAVHMACQSLLGGESDMALAGSVSISFPQRTGYLHQEGGVLSPDGHCRAFDAQAAGAVEGAGAGVVVLKRLGDALADGDTIHAVIRGSAANNDGSGKVGFTAPSVTGQSEVIRESLLMADVDPATVTYVEAHGSGTPLGDPVEMAALTQAFEGAPQGHCAVGSVKTNVGHLNSAAGMAGLFKTALALEHKILPPSLHFESPNPQIDFAGSPFHVNARLTPWESEGPRRAGVSSFGLGGTNVHAVLEEAPEPKPASPARPWQLLLLSARSAAALDAAAANLAAHLEKHPELDGPALEDVAWTLQVGRRLFPHRRALVSKDAADARALLAQPDPARVAEAVEGSSGRPVAFLFPGLGDHYVDMGRELYAAEPRFREELDRCAEFLQPLLGLDLREAIFSGDPATPRPRGTGSGTDLKALLRRASGGVGGPVEDEALRRLSRTEIAQPALFAVEYALAQLLLSWGLRPSAMIGYSIGEYVAACLAGVMSLEDALTLVATRALRISELPGGAMLAIPLPEAEVRPFLSGGLALSATNGPHLSVAGGSEEAVARLEAELTARGVACLRLHATHAFHTPALSPALEPFLEAARKVKLAAPEIPFLSNVTGTWITDAEATDPAYWGRHMLGTVRFAEGLAELLSDPARVLLEVGPGSTLSTLARQHPGAAAAGGGAAISTMRRASDERADAVHLLDALGRLWAAGVTIDWPAYHAGEKRRRVPLPTYPFERQRYWIDPPAQAAGEIKERADGTPAVPGTPAPARRTDVADWTYAPVWREAPALPGTLARLLDQAREAGPWLLFLDRSGVGERLAARLEAAGATVSTVREGELAGEKGPREAMSRLLHELRANGRFPRRVVHLWSAAPGELGFEAAQEAGLLSLIHLAHALGEEGHSEPLSLLVAASAVQAVGEGDPVEPARATLLGACRVIPQEYVHIACRSVDLILPASPSLGSDAATDRLTHQLLAEALATASGRAEEVALRGRRRFLRAWEPVRLPAVELGGRVPPPWEGAVGEGGRLGGGRLPEPQTSSGAGAPPPGLPLTQPSPSQGEEPALPLRREGVYLVTDILHGIGLPLAEALRERVGCRLALLVPRDLAPASRSERLAALAASPDVLLLPADVTSAADLCSAASQARERFGSLSGVFHTAGAFSGGLIQLKSPETLPAVFGDQGRGALAIVQAFAAPSDPPLDFLALAASIATVTGGFGQLDPTAAGALLGALAEQGEGTVRTFAWDPYQWDSWLAAGLAQSTPALEASFAGDVATYGVTSAASLDALSRLLASGLPRAVVAAEDLDAVIAQTDAFHAADLLASMTGGSGGGGKRTATGPYVPPRDEVEAALARIWEELFGIDRIGVEDDFLALGGHSLLAIQVTTQIRNNLDVDLPVSALFEQPTIALLARRVREERGEPEPEELDALLAEIEGLSPEEVQALLAAERAALEASAS